MIQQLSYVWVRPGRVDGGFSINHKIKRVRTEQVARMLIETDLTVSQITNLLGYTDPQHIARYFRREKGMTP